jgi:hypothetical protein
MRLSLKLGALCAAAAAFPLIIASLVVFSQISSHWRGQSLDQLKGDARAASAIYEKRMVEMRGAAQRLADEIAIQGLMGSDSADHNNSSWSKLQDMLPKAQNDLFLDFLIITDAQGRVMARHNDRPAPGETLLGEDKNAVAEKVLSTGKPGAATAVERGERYARLGLDRVAPVKLKDGSMLNEALMIEAGAPIWSNGRASGSVLIGQMLNTYYKPRAGASSLQTPLVAEIRQALNRSPDEDGGALIALGAAIVTSSIPVSTRGDTTTPPLTGAAHDPAKTEETLQSGDHEYSVAWQPLKSLDGAQLGAVGIARPAGEIDNSLGSSRTSMMVIGLIVTLAAGAAGFVWGRSMGLRLDDLAQAATRWRVGELSMPARNGDRPLPDWIPNGLVRDEISHLADELDEMRESFRQAIERLRKR